MQEFEAEGWSKPLVDFPFSLHLPQQPMAVACGVCAGQMQVWNPDEPSTPRGLSNPLSPCLEERLREACDQLDLAWDGCAGHSELLALCQQLGLEVRRLQLIAGWLYVCQPVESVTGSFH